MPSAVILVGTVLVSSHLSGSVALAVYALSFWHYLLYWWAYRFGAVVPVRFRRDAVSMKAIALVALGVAYFDAPWHWWSGAAVASGFLLNALAARALGPARTYYGWELGELPAQRVTGFPYSVVPHPMLLGNMAAYAGTLLNPEFRAAWWPLAGAHVGLNLALILMETAVTPRRHGADRRPVGRSRRGYRRPVPGGARLLGGIAAIAAGAAFGAAAAEAAGWAAGAVPCSAVVASAVLYAFNRSGWYLEPAHAVGRHRLHSLSREAT